MKLRTFAICIAVLAAALFLAFRSEKYSTRGNKTDENKMSASDQKELVLNYLTEPKFTSADLLFQLTGANAELEWLDVDKKMVYLSLSENEDWKASLKKLCLHPENVQGAKRDPDSNGVLLGDLRFNKPGKYYFMLPKDDLSINLDATITVRLSKSITYDMSVQELCDFIGNNVLLNGYAWLPYTQNGGVQTIIRNFGASIAKVREPSLTRLVDRIVKKTDSKEVVCQKLLYFVNICVPYDQHEKEWSTSQVVKRPNESLMTKTATCAGQAVLYASLLNQKGIKFKLVYYHDHLTVLVEGYFTQLPGTVCFIFGKDCFSLADPTITGFKIGESIPNKAEGFIKDWVMMQDPLNDLIFPNKDQGVKLVPRQ